MSFINFNSQLLHEHQPLLPAQHRAIRYGDGIFESMRVENHKLFFPDLHAARLTEALEILNMRIPFTLDADFLSAQVLRLCQANGHPSARVRLQVFREGEGFYAPSSSSASFSISSAPAEEGGFTLPHQGAKLCTFREQTKSYGRLSSLKSSSALLYVMASAYASAHQCSEALILNQHARVAEASSSNIWFLKDDKWYTPSLQDAGVDGVMRRVLLKILSELSIPFFETSIATVDIPKFDFVLLSNASRGLRYVESIDEFSFKRPEITHVLRLLNDWSMNLH